MFASLGSLTLPEGPLQALPRPSPRVQRAMEKSRGWFFKVITSVSCCFWREHLRRAPAAHPGHGYPRRTLDRNTWAATPGVPKENPAVAVRSARVKDRPAEPREFTAPTFP